MSTQRQYVAVWKSGQHIKWRGLSMREYRQFTRRLDFEPEMAVFCDLYRLVVDLDECPPIERATAGVVDFLGRTLLDNSAFSGDIYRMQQRLNDHRAALQSNYFEECKAVLAGIFRYTFEEIDSWDEETFFDRLAKAELLSGEDLSPKKVEPAPKAGAPHAPPKQAKKPLTKTQQMALERTMSTRRAP